jgi:hypothetical protein
VVVVVVLKDLGKDLMALEVLVARVHLPVALVEAVGLEAVQV